MDCETKMASGGFSTQCRNSVKDFNLCSPRLAYISADSTASLLPSPLLGGGGGAGGGGRAVGHQRTTPSRPPTPTLPQPKPSILGFRPLNLSDRNRQQPISIGGREKRSPAQHAGDP